MLAISALVHSYCRRNEGCGELQEVREIIDVFEDNLRYNCKTDDQQLQDRVGYAEISQDIFIDREAGR